MRAKKSSERPPQKLCLCRYGGPAQLHLVLHGPDRRVSADFPSENALWPSSSRISAFYTSKTCRPNTNSRDFPGFSAEIMCHGQNSRDLPGFTSETADCCGEAAELCRARRALRSSSWSASVAQRSCVSHGTSASGNCEPSQYEKNSREGFWQVCPAVRQIEGCMAHEKGIRRAGGCLTL